MEIKTAEYARRGHPDRVCDIIADSILDEYLKQDPYSRVAVEVFGCHGVVTIGGEVTSKGKVDVKKVAKEVYKEIGYKSKIKVNVRIKKQSSEISMLADEGAGDSGIVTGYAAMETPEMLPLEVALAKRIADKLDDDGKLEPDGKIQVTLKDGFVSNIVVAFQEKEGSNSLDYVERVIESVIPKSYQCKDIKLICIPFNIGGFDADTGLTGRKNVLWYGPRIPIGGGAFAGKDATKVDRSGAYFARYIAINVMKITKESALVEMAYVIGENNPLYIKVNGKKLDRNIFLIGGSAVSEVINKFNLRQPIFKETSLKGHFGTNKFSWDKI